MGSLFRGNDTLSVSYASRYSIDHKILSSLAEIAAALRASQ